LSYRSLRRRSLDRSRSLERLLFDGGLSYSIGGVRWRFERGLQKFVSVIYGQKRNKCLIQLFKCRLLQLFVSLNRRILFTVKR
jgi:hypothetical protein